jgi:hypothetical protein
MVNQSYPPNRDALEHALIEAIHDEYKARATYRQIIQTFGPVRPFVNILQSEQRHIRALTALFEKYAIALPLDDWDTRVTVPASIQDACQQGVEAELENGEMYQRLLQETHGYPDVQAVFSNLQRASQQNHLRAFQRCANHRSARPNDSHRHDAQIQEGQAQDSDKFVTPPDSSSIPKSPRCRRGAGKRHRHRGGQRRLNLKETEYTAPKDGSAE